MSVLSTSLIADFRSTHFQVFASAGPAFTLRVDQPSVQLAQLHRENGVTQSAYLTAWNPLSADTPVEVNHAQQSKLLDEMRAAGHTMVPGFGMNPANDYPGEDHLLVLGIGREQAIACGKRYQQNSILWCGESATPELILLR